jgi:hypothetical protein
MNVIFLDIDGVLCTTRQAVAINDRGVMSCLDPVALQFLDRIARDFDVKYVISSTWRMGESYSYFRSLFMAAQARDLAMALYYDDWATPVIHEKDRGHEIQNWIDRNKPENYIILDDDSDMLDHQKEFFVQTSCYDGMLFEHYKKVEELLKSFGS